MSGGLVRDDEYAHCLEGDADNGQRNEQGRCRLQWGGALTSGATLAEFFHLCIQPWPEEFPVFSKVFWLAV